MSDPEKLGGADNNSQTQRRTGPDPGWFRKWYEFQKKEDERVLAELREKIGPDGDLRAAYQAWYNEQMREHDEGLILMLQNLHHAEIRAAKDVVS
jgi:hypothetical protein